MIKTNNTPCTYEELYYEMWETAGRYSKITRFQVIGSSHDERMIPAVWVGNGNQTVFCIAGMIGTDRHMPGYTGGDDERIHKSLGMWLEA